MVSTPVDEVLANMPLLALRTERGVVPIELWQLAGDQQLVSGQSVDHRETQNDVQLAAVI